MATLESRLNLLAQAIGADIKTLTIKQGDLTALSTTSKANIVSALNEVFAMAQSAGGGGAINDTTPGTGTTYSSTKIASELSAAVESLRTELRAGAGAALDTFNELAAALNNDASFATTIATALGKRLRVDAIQSFSLAEKLQGRQNLDAFGSIELGNPDADFVTVYATAKV